MIFRRQVSYKIRHLFIQIYIDENTVLVCLEKVDR